MKWLRPGEADTMMSLTVASETQSKRSHDRNRVIDTENKPMVIRWGMDWGAR